MYVEKSAFYFDNFAYPLTDLACYATPILNRSRFAFFARIKFHIILAYDIPDRPHYVAKCLQSNLLQANLKIRISIVSFSILRCQFLLEKNNFLRAHIFYSVFGYIRRTL